jgi:hypothetical protein
VPPQQFLLQAVTQCRQPPAQWDPASRDVLTSAAAATLAWKAFSSCSVGKQLSAPVSSGRTCAVTFPHGRAPL